MSVGAGERVGPETTVGATVSTFNCFVQKWVCQAPDASLEEMQLLCAGAVRGEEMQQVLAVFANGNLYGSEVRTSWREANRGNRRD